MKRPGITVALAMTWDGARYPARSLRPKARAFLAHNSRALPSQNKMSALFANERVNEIRVCWVSKLRGGDEVLCDAFPAPSGKRMRFQSTRTVRFGDVLGVIYRPTAGK